MIMCVESKGIQMTDEACQVLIGDIGFKAELVLQGDGKGENEVQS